MCVCINERVLMAVNAGHQQPRAGHEEDLVLMIANIRELAQLGPGARGNLEHDALVIVSALGASNRNHDAAAPRANAEVNASSDTCIHSKKRV